MHCQALTSHFDDINWLSLFAGHTLDEISKLVNTTVLEGWNCNAIVKHVNSNSRPWFPKEVKNSAKDSRFWRDRVRECESNNSTHAFVDGLAFHIDDCRARASSAADDSFQDFSIYKTNCEKWINRQADHGLHQLMRRIYQVPKRSIPHLKRRVDGSKKLQVIATSNRQKADLFAEQFIKNCEIPPDFPVHPEHSKLSLFLNDKLTLYHFTPGGELECSFDFNSFQPSHYQLQIIQTMCLSFDIFIPPKTCIFDTIDVCNDLFYFQEISMARQKLKKGVGSRGINNEHLRKLKSGGLDFGIQFYFNILFYFNFWPSDYRLAHIFPLLKGGLRKIWEVNDYRGISILDTFCKFLETIVYNRVIYLIASVLSPFQAGGRAMHGTSCQLIRVLEAIWADVSQTRRVDGKKKPKNFVIAALLDAAKAFDKKNRRVLLQKLWKSGVKGRLFKFIVAFFYDRRQCVRVEDAFSDCVSTMHGGPQGSKLTLIFFLLYINDSSEGSRADGEAMFVDDLMLWITDTNQARAARRLNAELSRIHNWSIFNTMIFEPSKFHILDLGKRTVQDRYRALIKFGCETPEWSEVAPYLGVLIDDELTMIPHMKKQGKKAHNASFRLTNHAKQHTSCSPATLAIIFQLWVLPHLAYGSENWIFLVKTKVHLKKKPRGKYKEAYESMEKLYLRCARLILGAQQNPSNDAVLVRLGWLPLDYLLMYRAIVWFLKGRQGLAGPALHDLISKWESCPSKKHDFGARVFRPALDAITRLQTYIPDVDLLTTPIKQGCAALRTAMFAELTSLWNASDHAKFTRLIHPEWSKRQLPSTMHSKCTHSWYHSVALGRGPFRDRMKEMRKRDCNLCRYGCNVVESPEHVLLYCRHVEKARGVLRRICVKRDLRFSIKTLLCNSHLQIGIEKLMADFMKSCTDTDT